MKPSTLKLGIFGLLLGLSLVRGLLYSAIIPPWQAPDEPKHFEYLRTLYEQRRLVGPADISLAVQHRILASMHTHNFWAFWIGAGDPNNPLNDPDVFASAWAKGNKTGLSEVGRVPPLYFIIAALSQLLASEDITVQLYSARLVSIMLGMLVVFIALLTARELFPGDDFLIIGIPFFVAFLPMYTFITSSVHPDSLACLLTSLVLYVIINGFKHGFTWWRTLAIAGLIVLGALAKKTTIITFPIAILAIAFHLWTKRAKIPVWRCLRLAIGVIVTGVLLGSWMLSQWHDRIQSLLKYAYSYLFYYSGMAKDILRNMLPRSENLELYRINLRQMFESFWARFGWLNIRLDDFWYRAISLVCLAALVGLLPSLYRLMMRKPGLLAPWQKKSLLLFFLSIALMFLITLAFFSAYFSNLRLTLVQGRYLFPAIIPIATFFMLGLREIFPPRLRRWGLLAWVAGLFLFDALSMLFYIVPFFYGQGISTTSLEAAGLLLDRLAENKPLLWGSKRFYALLSSLYLMLFGLFLWLILRTPSNPSEAEMETRQ